MRTAVSATLRSPFRCILRPEPCEGAVRNYGLARLSYKPTEDIQVMTALGKDYRSGFLRISPVAPDIGMCHVAALYRFHVLNAYQLSYHSIPQSLVHCPEIRAVPQDVANGHDPSIFMCLGGNVGAFLFRLCDRLFQKYVISPLQCLHARIIMQVIRG